MALKRPFGNGPFTGQDQPIRRRLLDVPRLVLNRGGEYIFVPGLRALRWLSGLQSNAGDPESSAGLGAPRVVACLRFRGFRSHYQ